MEELGVGWEWQKGAMLIPGCLPGLDPSSTHGTGMLQLASQAYNVFLSNPTTMPGRRLMAPLGIQRYLRATEPGQLWLNSVPLNKLHFCWKQQGTGRCPQPSNA